MAGSRWLERFNSVVKGLTGVNYVVEYSSGCVHCLYLREFMMSSAVWLTTIICWCVECWYIDTVYSMEQLNVKNLYCTLLMICRILLS